MIERKPARRFDLEPRFREELISRASVREGGDSWLGRKLGYSINFGFRVRQLKRGEVRPTYAQLKTLSEITGINLDEILRHTRKQGLKHERKRSLH